MPSAPAARTTKPSPHGKELKGKKPTKLQSAFAKIKTKLKKLVKRSPRRSTKPVAPPPHGMTLVRRIPAALLSTEFMLGELDDLDDDDNEDGQQKPSQQQQQKQQPQYQPLLLQKAGRRMPPNLDKTLPALPVEASARQSRVRDSWMTVDRWVE